jgi:hypothetical protein
MTMRRTFIKIASLGILLGAVVLPARADWFNYVVRTSGLAWSDGYHAYDQCPPKKGHFPQHPLVLPGYDKPERHAPYYFEERQERDRPSASAQEQLPSAPTNAPALRGPDSPMSSTLPDPQARYKPRSRYFEALQRESQPAEQLQARRPANAPPF